MELRQEGRALRYRGGMAPAPSHPRLQGGRYLKASFPAGSLHIPKGGKAPAAASRPFLPLPRHLALGKTLPTAYSHWLLTQKNEGLDGSVWQGHTPGHPVLFLL